MNVCEEVFGAGDGDRTRTTSLEGWGSTIELHPQRLCNMFYKDLTASARRKLLNIFDNFI